MILYHCTTPHKLERYIESKQIFPPVRGWKWLNSAKEWNRKTGRTLILEIETGDEVYPLPDHKPLYHSFWTPNYIKEWKLLKP